uniref:UDP-N-acetylglucosamine--dolichyl-phosphate N-acetylglucosaminephosphotransferase n=1 Tax=Meloidogyne incognita TaxID=6306 RepID=A0A914N4U4_MELIC
MASSDFDMETENLDPDFTPKTIAEKLKLGDDFADWLSKEKFSEEDPVLVLNFVGMDFLHAQNRDDIKKALVPIGYRGENGDNVLFTTEPTILTSVIFSYSDETTKVLDLHLNISIFEKDQIKMFWRALVVLFVNSLMSLLAGLASYHFMLQFLPIFIQRKLYGLDQCKIDKKPVPEPIGVIAAAIYLIFLFTFIPLPFYDLLNQRAIFTGENGLTNIECDNSSLLNLLSLLAGLVSICTAVLLGFADDILDLRWRHKLLFPTLSSMPLLLVYLLSKNSTAVLLPHFLQKYLGGASFLDIGPFYYIYMVSLVIFCTNAINIIAGINGVEVGQSLVITASIALFNTIQVIRSVDSIQLWHHVLSLCFILPFIGTSTALFIINKYPAKAFVGDTYCYWAGMTIAVSALTGRFSKTLLLFLLPQIINFIFSCPQLFHLIPCPRHRLPRLNENGKLEMSMVEFQPHKLSKIGNVCFRILGMARLIYYKEYIKDGESWVSMNNLTILNLILKFNRPQFEWELTNKFIILQILCSIFAFFCRFCLARIFYDEVN